MSEECNVDSVNDFFCYFSYCEHTTLELWSIFHPGLCSSLLGKGKIVQGFIFQFVMNTALLWVWYNNAGVFKEHRAEEILYMKI